MTTIYIHNILERIRTHLLTFCCILSQVKSLRPTYDSLASVWVSMVSLVNYSCLSMFNKLHTSLSKSCSWWSPTYMIQLLPMYSTQWFQVMLLLPRPTAWYLLVDAVSSTDLLHFALLLVTVYTIISPISWWMFQQLRLSKFHSHILSNMAANVSCWNVVEGVGTAADGRRTAFLCWRLCLFAGIPIPQWYTVATRPLSKLFAKNI